MSVSPCCVLSVRCYFISQMKAEKPIVPCSDIVRPVLCSGTSTGKGFPSLRPPYPSWSALKNNTPAVHTRRFVSATAALEIANFPHQRLAAILHICPSLLNLFSPQRRLKFSDKVHYGSMMAFNMGDVLLFPSHWANLRKCTEGKKKSLWATLWWQDL